MFYHEKILSFIFLLLFVTSLTVAQSYFKDYKSGEQNFSEQKYTEAIENFTNVIAAKNDHDRAYNYRGLCYFYTNDYDKAVADFEKAVELKEKSDEYHLNHGKALMALNKNKEAIAAFDISIDRNKKQTAAYTAKIQAQMQGKMFMDAIATAEQLLSIEKMELVIMFWE